MQINVSHLCECRASSVVTFTHTCLHLNVDLLWSSVSLDQYSQLNNEVRVNTFSSKYRWWCSSIACTDLHHYNRTLKLCSINYPQLYVTITSTTLWGNTICLQHHGDTLNCSNQLSRNEHQYATCCKAHDKLLKLCCIAP